MTVRLEECTIKQIRKIDFPSIQAVLFDMDGLLVDSERIAQQCCIQAGRDLGYPMDEALAHRFLGVTRDRCIQILKEAFPAIDPERYFDYSHRHFDELLTKNLIPKPGAAELLSYLRQAGIPYALASSSGRERVAKSLQLTALDIFFPEDIRITGERAQRSKPAPDLFLTAANALGVPPESCLVLEDSVNGIQAGRAADCMVCMVPDLVPYDEAMAPWCDQVADDLGEVLDWMRK